MISALRAIVARLGDRAPRELIDQLSTLEGAPESARPRIQAAIAALHPAIRPLLRSPEIVVCPAYPQAGAEEQARLTLGWTPQEVMRGLSAREAHLALRDGWTVVGYLCRDLPESVARPGTVQVARWLGEAWADPPRREALELRRTMPGPGGAIIEGRLLDRVDELRPVDVRRTLSVQEAFRRAADRMWRRWADQHRDDHDQIGSVPRWWHPIRCARILSTRAALVREGEEQHHCVGFYAAQVAAKESVILSICVRDREGMLHRSTAEMSPSGEVRQHRGRGNEAPPELCARALARIIARIHRRAVDRSAA